MVCRYRWSRNKIIEFSNDITAYPMRNVIPITKKRKASGYGIHYYVILFLYLTTNYFDSIIDYIV